MKIIKTAGYRVVRPIDPNEYPPRPGLEGPFRNDDGRVLYYDPKEGKYWDPKTDIYDELEGTESLRNMASSNCCDSDLARKFTEGFAEKVRRWTLGEADHEKDSEFYKEGDDEDDQVKQKTTKKAYFRLA